MLWKKRIFLIKDEMIGIDSQIRFRFLTTFKILLTTLISAIALLLLLWLVLEIDFLFFSSFEFNGQAQFRNTFFEFISNKVSDVIPMVALFFGLVIFFGFYTSNLMLRPFKQISKFCESFEKDPENAQYDPDFFSDLKLLTRFSEFFFIKVKDLLQASDNNEKVEIDIPDRYRKFHTPIFEAGFFFHASFMIIIIAVISFVGCHRILLDVHESLLSLAAHTLKSEKEIVSFLGAQSQIFDSLTWIVLLIHIILNIFLVFNLYSKVSIPAFGIFATMRGFLRGNLKARIHLLGNYYLRPETKKINHFLSEVEKKLTKS